MLKKTLTIGASILFGAMMLNSGINKFLHYMVIPPMAPLAEKTLQLLNETGWIMILVAIVEIIAGLFLITPKTRALGTIMITPIVIGIALFHIILNPTGIGLAIILLGFNAYLILINKDKLLPIIK